MAAGCAGSSISTCLPRRRSSPRSCSPGCTPRGRCGVIEPQPSRDHSEIMLGAFGAEVTTRDGVVELGDRRQLRGARIDIWGDPSAAAFGWVAAAIVPGSSVETRGVMVNPLRVGILDWLERMGADVTVRNPEPRERRTGHRRDGSPRPPPRRRGPGQRGTRDDRRISIARRRWRPSLRGRACSTGSASCGSRRATGWPRLPRACEHAVSRHGSMETRSSVTGGPVAGGEVETPWRSPDRDGVPGARSRRRKGR